MARVNLIAGYDEYDSSTLGLFILGTEHMEGMMATRPDYASTLAHDVVEHLNGPYVMDQVWDELEALGASWFTRSDFSQVEFTLTGDLENLMYSEQTVPDIGPPVVEDEDIREQFETFFDASQPPEDVDKSTLRVAWINRMLHGYRKAFVRWNGSAMNAYETFERIKNSVSDCPELEYEGQLLVLDTNEGRISYVN